MRGEDSHLAYFYCQESKGTDSSTAALSTYSIPDFLWEAIETIDKDGHCNRASKAQILGEPKVRRCWLSI